MAAWRPAPMAVSILYPHQRQLSRRVRVLVDWMADLMRQEESAGQGIAGCGRLGVSSGRILLRHRIIYSSRQYDDE